MTVPKRFFLGLLLLLGSIRAPAQQPGQMIYIRAKEVKGFLPG